MTVASVATAAKGAKVLPSGPIGTRVLACLPYLFALYAVATLVSMAGMEILGWVSATFILVAWLSENGKRKILWQQSHLWIDGVLGAFFVIIALGAVFAAPDSADKITVIGKARWIFLFFLLRMGLFWIWSERVKKVCVVLGSMMLVIAIYACIQHYTGIDLVRPGSHRAVQPFGITSQGWHVFRVAGVMSSPIRYGHSLAMLIGFPFAAGFVYWRQGQRRLASLWMATAAFMFMALVMTLTRGAWIGGISALLVICAYLGPKTLLKISSALLLFGVIAYHFNEEMVLRLDSIIDPNFHSNTQRMVIWKTNLQMALEHPFLGMGYGQNEYLIKPFMAAHGITGGMGGHAHNNFLQMLTGTGVFGFLCYITFIGFFLWLTQQLWRILPENKPFERTLVLGALGAQVAMHMGGLVECSFTAAELNHQFMLSLSLVTVMYWHYQQRSQIA